MSLKDYGENYEKVSIGSSFKVSGGFEKWKAQKFSQYFLTPTEEKEGKVVLHFGNIDDEGNVAEDKSFRVSSSGQIVRFHKELMQTLGLFVGIEEKNASQFFQNIKKGLKKDFRKGVKRGHEMRKRYYEEEGDG